MNIFVTGGAGYVGSHCIRALCEAGHNVVVYDNLSTGHRDAVEPPATLVVGDLGDTNRLKATLADGAFDAVMHFAALAEVGESVKHPLLYYRNNLSHTVSLLEQMQEHGIKKVIPDGVSMAQAARQILAERRLQKVIDEARPQVLDECKSLHLPQDLRQKVLAVCETEPALPWDVALVQIL